MTLRRLLLLPLLLTLPFSLIGCSLRNQRAIRRCRRRDPCHSLLSRSIVVVAPISSAAKRTSKSQRTAVVSSSISISQLHRKEERTERGKQKQKSKKMSCNKSVVLVLLLHILRILILLLILLLTFNLFNLSYNSKRINFLLHDEEGDL